MSRFSRTLRFLALTSSTMAIAACGGGGGGGKGQKPIEFTLTSSASIDFSADETDGIIFKPGIVSGRISAPLNQIYLQVELEDLQLIRAVSFTGNSDTSGELVFHPAYPDILGRGHYEEAVIVRICGDSACNNELVGSPVNISVNYNVTPFDSVNMGIVITGNGGVTQSNGMLQCNGSCYETVYGSDGETIHLSAHPEPGYEFSGWGGDCVGTESCTLSFSTGNEYSVTATFKSSDKLFEICPENDIPAEGMSGVAVVNEATSFIPLCGGMVLVADNVDNTVKLIDVATNTEINRYSLSAATLTLAIDEENTLLYALHFDKEYISRIDLKTGHVSEIHVRQYQKHYSGDTPAIAVSNSGVVFVYPENRPAWGMPELWYIDGRTGILLKRQVEETLSYPLRFNYVDSDTGGWLSTFSINTWIKYDFDPEKISFSQVRGQSGCIGAVSSDLQHAVFPCGHGRLEKAGYADVSLTDGTSLLGSWPRGNTSLGKYLSFSPSNKFVSLSEYSLTLFSVDNYERVFSYTGVEACNLSEDYRIKDLTKFAPDGRMAYLLRPCYDGTAQIVWAAFDTN